MENAEFLKASSKSHAMKWTKLAFFEDEFAVVVVVALPPRVISMA